jgi:hypothetical protein
LDYIIAVDVNSNPAALTIPSQRVDTERDLAIEVAAVVFECHLFLYTLAGDGAPRIRQAAKE